MLCKLSWQVRLVGLARTSPEPVLLVSGALRDSPRSQRGGRRSQDLPERDRAQCVAYGLQAHLSHTVSRLKEELQDDDQC